MNSVLCTICMRGGSQETQNKHTRLINGKPLMYAALASQKNHMAVYLMGCYMVHEIRNEFEKAYNKSGKRFDAGKSCIRFKKIDDLPLDLLGKTIASMDVNEFIELVEK